MKKDSAKLNSVSLTPFLSNLPRRLAALDVLRGVTIAGMIVVNDPGSWSHVYPPLRHAEWDGITPTDLVFPFFLYVVGVSIALALAKRRQAQQSSRSILVKILWRSSVLFALGLLLSLIPRFDFANLRIPGVLQRIAVVYFVCALVYLLTNWRGQAWLAAAALLVYWALMTLVPVPIDRVIQGALETGTVASQSGPVSLRGIRRVSEHAIAANLQPGVNLAAWVDRQLIPGRLWQKTWDPEGLLSTIPAIATGITGLLIGALLLSDQARERKVIWLLVSGFVSFVIGGIWSWCFPLNKNLWTSSYVLYTSGLATMTLGTLIWFIDVLGIDGWTFPFQVFGSNAIAAYVLHGVLAKLLAIPLGESGWRLAPAFMAWGQQCGLPAEFVSLLYALSYTLVIYAMVWLMYRWKIFLRV